MGEEEWIQMKKIEAIIREEKLVDVKEALEEAGILGLNVTEVRGRGRQKGIPLQWRASTYMVDMLSKLKLNVVVNDEDVDRVVDTIVNSAKTGREGDGMIFIMPVEEIIRVRTGERGKDAV
jgi:nitrogen regulatory protein P-II 1